MRLIAGFVLAALAATAVAATVENIVIRDGDHTYIDGRHDDTRLKRLGDRYAAFELDGVRYVITDKATLDRLDAAIARQVEIGKKQGELGARQGELGAKQGAIGAEQGRIGAAQAFARGERARELRERQQELGERQRELGEKQRELGEQQRELGELQREASREARTKLDSIFREAVRKGIAFRH